MSEAKNQGPPTVIYVTTATTTSKPNTLSTAAGGIIFVSGGMNMALGLGWSQYNFIGSKDHFCYSWFIGVIIGTVISAFLRNFIPKKFIMASSTLLILIAGILFTSLPYNYDALLAGRYLNGIAIGWATVTFLVHASEIAADSNRGSCLAIEQYGITFGIAVQMLYASYWSSTIDFSINRLHGIIDIVYAVIAAIFILLFVESPIDYIRKGDDAMALDCLGRLRQPKGVTMETNALLEQHKAYVSEEESLSLEQSLSRGFLPMLKMILFRSMMLAFVFSMPLNGALQLGTVISLNSWGPTLAACLRVLGAIIALCLVDNINRKISSLLPMVIIGCLLIGLGTLFQNYSNLINSTDMTTAMSLCIVIQAFAGFFTPYTSVYMGEAFPLLVKSYLMDVCVIVEQILQIILIVTLTIYIGDSLIAQGVIIVVVFFILCLTMPDTKRTSLTEAQRRHRNLLNLREN